jgi:hypothetical protein
VLIFCIRQACDGLLLLLLGRCIKRRKCTITYTGRSSRRGELLLLSDALPVRLPRRQPAAGALSEDARLLIPTFQVAVLNSYC